MYTLVIDRQDARGHGEISSTRRSYFELSDALTVYAIEVGQLLQQGFEYNWLMSGRQIVRLDSVQETVTAGVLDETANVYVNLPAGRQ